MARKDGATHDPTMRRRREARREGNVPRSPETTSMVVLAAALITVITTAPGALARTGVMLRDWLSRAGDGIGPSGDATAGDSMMRAPAIVSSALDMVRAWSPALVAAVVAGVAVNVAQAGVVVLPKTARPSFKQISLRRGLRQLNPKEAGYTLLRNLAKLLVVGAALVQPLLSLWHTIPTRAGLGAVAGACGQAASAIAIRVIAGAVLIAVLDQLVTRRRWRNQMMMTRQELMDEAKTTEGDPHTRAARRRRGMDLRRRRSLAPVSMADVVVTNPTHFAVALAYTAGSPSPQVIDKGAGRMAKRIRREASRHGVPIIENKPLARALYRQVRVGGYVPERFFDAVVSVLVAAYWRSGKVPGHLQTGVAA
jgi:flagellar biosynthetic protein FlhB